MPFKLTSLLLLFFFAAFFGCEGGLLEETPDTFISEAEAFRTEAGVDATLNGLYYSFSEHDYHGAAFHNLLMPVSGKFYSSQIANVDATGLNTTPSNPSLQQLWAQAYQTINEANIIITNLGDSSSDLANAESSLGQALFLRAVTYFDLVRLFGDVPLRTAPVTVDNLDAPRTSAAEVYVQIVADLEIAEELLPENEAGRPRPLAATAYLAKVFLTRGTLENNASFLEQARGHALEVVNSGEYALVPTFSDLFDPANENSTESIFELQYGHTGGVRLADFSRLYTPRGSIWRQPNVPTFGRIRPNKETFEQHLATYPDDPRIDATFLYGVYEREGEERTLYPARTRGIDGFPVLRKYFDFTYNGTTTSRNMILLRYADVLLMLAEIENELNGPDAAYPYVNQVLARARQRPDGTEASSPADYSGMSQEEFRAAIRQERLFELLGEGHAWFDTRRYDYDHLRTTVIEPHNAVPTFDQTKDFVYPDDPKNMLLPLPQTELAGNSMIDVSDQNPGY